MMRFRASLSGFPVFRYAVYTCVRFPVVRCVKISFLGGLLAARGYKMWDSLSGASSSLAVGSIGGVVVAVLAVNKTARSGWAGNRRACRRALDVDG